MLRGRPPGLPLNIAAVLHASALGSFPMLVDVLEPLLAFFVSARPFAEVSRLAVVSKALRRVSLNALKTAHQLNLSGFAESVTDGVVRLALVRVTSENLRYKRLCTFVCSTVHATSADVVAAPPSLLPSLSP